MMDSPEQPSTAKPATAARIYDYLLGGVHNFPADREVAQKVIEGLPFVREAARANRAFLARAVRYLADQGIDQYLDIGSGVPTQGNVHEIVHRVRPEARVVYVDVDPLAVAESLELLGGDPRAMAVRGDLRDPGAILAHGEVNRLLDFGEPVGLLLIAVLHFVADDEQAYGAVDHLLRDLVPGSHVVASHGATETAPSDTQTIGRTYDRQTMTGTAKPRDRTEFGRFFGDWDMVDPGIVWLSEWRPDPDDAPADPMSNVGWAAVARKPAREPAREP
jgi:hypothetical protein